MEQKEFFIDFLGQKYKVFYIKDVGLAERAIAKFMERDGPFGFDIETMSYEKYREDSTAPLDPLRSTPRLVQLCDGKNAFVFDLFFGIPISLFSNFLSTKRLLAHNAIFEIQHLIHNFKVPEADVGCTYLATKLLHHALYVDDGGIGARLEDVVSSLFKVKIKKDIPHKYWFEPDLTHEQIEYAALDAIVLPKVAEKLQKGLAKYGLFQVYKLYKDAQWPLAKMQLNGMKLDVEKHRELIAAWKKDAYEAKKELITLTGLSEITAHTMADYLERNLEPSVLAIWPRTEKDKLQTDANAFSEFSWLPIVKPFARFQKATILSSSFGMKLQHKISQVDGRIHCQYKLCGTRTGRLSAVNPNLHQMPHDPITRSIFICEPKKVLIRSDYDQVELRICAECSQDEEMLRAYRNGIDLHKLTACQISGKKIENLTDDDRFKAKALNFGLVFGLGIPGYQRYVKKQFGVEVATHQAYQSVTDWHTLYNGYTVWHREQAKNCKHTLQVRTVTGKLRKLDKDNYYGASANTKIQGSASECILNALCLLNKYEVPAKIINCVHDEIVLECENTIDTIKFVSEKLQEAMVMGYQAVFPKGLTRGLIKKVGHGLNWAEAK